MIARRFQSMGLAAIGMACAMGFYLISSHVAAERTELEKVDRQILATKRDIRQLQTEIDTRASMRQLERWNGDVLALTAPDARQYVSETALNDLDRLGIPDGPRFMPAGAVTAMTNPAMAAAGAPQAPVAADAVAPNTLRSARKAFAAENAGAEPATPSVAVEPRKAPTAAQIESKLLKTPERAALPTSRKAAGPAGQMSRPARTMAVSAREPGSEAGKGDKAVRPQTKASATSSATKPSTQKPAPPKPPTRHQAP